MEMNIGKRIRELRKESGWTQQDLSERLATTQDTVSLWELGKSFPDVQSLVKLCRLFDVTADYLLGMSDI